MFTENDRVIIQNVQSLVELNGSEARVCSFDAEKQRYAVELLYSDEKLQSKTARNYSLKGECLRLLKEGDEEEVKGEEEGKKRKERDDDGLDEEEDDDDEDGDDDFDIKEEEEEKATTKKIPKKEPKPKKAKKEPKSNADKADDRRRLGQKSLWFTPWDEKKNMDKFDPQPLFDEEGKYKPAEEEKEFVKLKEKYQEMKGEELKKCLKANGLSSSGVKEILILKCIDGEMFGGMTRCPHCSKSEDIEKVPFLNVRYESPYHISKDKEKLGRGEVFCPGYWSPESAGMVRCNFSKKLIEFERPKWRTFKEYLIENPPLTSDQMKEKEEKKANEEGTMIPTEKLIKLKEENLGDDTRVALALIKIMKEEKLPVPDDLSNTGAVVLAWLKLEECIDEETGELNLEEVYKLGLKQWPPGPTDTYALCEKNIPLVAALNKMVTTARKRGSSVVDAIKVAAYAGAAKNISLLDYDVTLPNSGKGMLGKTVKGLKVGKVAGVGKGIADMIDYWIDNNRTSFGKKWELDPFDEQAYIKEQNDKKIAEEEAKQTRKEKKGKN